MSEADEMRQDAIVEKCCTKCGDTKPVSEFCRRKHKTMVGWSSWCKPCEKRRTACSKCKGPKTGNHSAYCRSCYNAFKRDHYANNRDAEIARSAAYNKKHPERVAKNMRECRARDPERFREQQRIFRKKNPEKVRIWHHNKHAKRRAAKYKTVSGRITRNEWDAIKEKHGHRCIYCLKKPPRLTMDHFIPLSKGGEHTASNIVPACHLCNSRKTNIDPQEFARRNWRLCW